MIKAEINEIKRLFTPSNCSITRICGCYVDGEKNKKRNSKKRFFLYRKKKFLSTSSSYAKIYQVLSEKIF